MRVFDSLFADVSENVGKLIGYPEGQGSVVNTLRGCFRLRIDSHHRNAHQTDGSSDIVAVKVEIIEVVVSRFPQVHSHSFDHVSKWLQNKKETLDESLIRFKCYEVGKLDKAEREADLNVNRVSSNCVSESCIEHIERTAAEQIF